ncbi:PepSY domain-containing protein [Motiliproteus sp. SC1-56]|uniref:PepSY domain-containing protein n=1 Tax=Motiliproteus sp. SC1-56 TaxID=2799565 RepID=UPI001A8F2301|nr:PepSY domain-containing protein [Motiliproteus sp. SC1-56]
MNSARQRFLPTWLLLVLLAATPAQAELSPDQAARRVQKQFGGQVLDIQPVKTGRGRAYRIKLLQPSGRVKLMLLDAEDGRPKRFKDVKPKDD